MAELDLFGNEIPDKQKRGGGASMLHCIGASNHSKQDRAENDFYATSPAAVQMLCDLEEFDRYCAILEPSCGAGHISEVLKSRGYTVCSRDLVDRGYGEPGHDFLSDEIQHWHGDIVMNPPYNLALPFVEKALEILRDGGKLAAFLKLTFAESASRRPLFDTNPPKRVWVSSNRIECARNGVFTGASAVCYSWWIWENGFRGHTELRWFN